MSAELSAVCEQAVSALVNGTGQGMLVVLLLALFFKLFRNLNAATRHAFDLVVIVLLALLPVAHFYTGTITPLSLEMPVSASRAPVELEEAAPVELSTGEPPARFEEPVVRSMPSESNVTPAAPIQESSIHRDWTFFVPRSVSAGVVGIWVVAALFRLGSLALQLLALRGLKRNGRNAPERARELFSKLCVELKVNRAPQLRVAPEITVPLAAGFKQPAVLLPERLCEHVSETRLEEILRHELAHVVRRDDWANLLQQCIRALFFFHPGVIWASQRMTIDREVACDDHVLSACRDRKGYALALAEFASRRQRWNVIAAPAAWSKYSQLKERIDMILETKRNSAPRLARGKASLFAAAAILIATLAFYSAPRLAFADAPAEPVPAEPAAPPAPPAPPAADALPAPPAVPPGDVFIAPDRAVILAQGRKRMVAIADGDDSSEEGGPRVKVFRRGPDEEMQRRLDRLEQMVEKLVQRDEVKKNLQFEFHEKANPNFNLNQDQYARLNEKAARAAERAARDAERATADVQKRVDELAEANGDGALDPERQKRALELIDQQHRLLEAQMHALEAKRHALEAQMRKMQDEMKFSADGNPDAQQPRKIKPTKRKKVEPQNDSGDAEQNKPEVAPDAK